MKRAVIGAVVLLVVTPGLLFASAGTLAWPMGWAYAGVVVTGSVTAHLIVAKKNPDTIRERARGLRAEGTQSWDRWLAPLVVWSPVAAILVAGYDFRFGWSSMVGLAVQIGALAVAAAGYAGAGWAMVENRFFVAGARLQQDRGQTVVRSGPYRLVRHPGYAASVLATLAIPFVLDSAWALVPAAVGVVALVARTALEDRMLRRGLEGYERYAGSTRDRLLPGVW